MGVQRKRDKRGSSFRLLGMAQLALSILLVWSPCEKVLASPRNADEKQTEGEGGRWE